MTARRLLRLVLIVLLPSALVVGAVGGSAVADVLPPKDVHLVEATATSINVGWSRPENASLFRVAVSPTASDPGPAERVAWTVQTDLTVGGLEPGTSYDVRVRVVDGHQFLSPFSAPLTVSTLERPGEPGTPPAPGETLFGGSYTTDSRVDEGVYEGRAEVARIFFQQLDNAAFNQNGAVRQALSDGVRAFVISWKETDLATIRGFLAGIPDGLTVYTSFNHEPENDAGPPGSSTYDSWAAEYRNQWVRQSPVMREAGCVPTSILMAYTLVASSDRDVADWTPPGGAVDVFAFDAYYGKGKVPGALVERMSAAARDAGVGVTGLGETGAPVGDLARVVNTAAMRAAVLLAGNFEWAIYWNSVQEGYDSRMDRAVADAWFGS